MTDISNKLHITEKSKETLGNNSGKNEDLVKTFQHLPDPEAIKKQAEKMQKQKAKEAEEKIERWEIEDNDLLNKTNMTAKDKEWMQKAIKCLVSKNMDNPENRKKLFAINYAKNYIEIWGVKRARKDITAIPNGKNIFQHNNVTYFKRSEEMIKELNKLLAKENMEIPLDSAYRKTMKALPEGKDKLGCWYEWWNILALITDMQMDGFCSSDGKFDLKNTHGYRCSASPKDVMTARKFGFSSDEGRLFPYNRDYANPVRPVLK